MTTVVWFSFPRDYGKLARSVASVRRHDPAARVVLAIPEGDEAPDVPGEIHRTAFHRGQHLNGPECVAGVAKTLGSQAGELVVKLDSDMEVVEPFWLDGPAVFRRCPGPYVGAYALPARVLRRVWESMEAVPHEGGHEALAICRRALAVDGSVRVLEAHGVLPDCLRWI